MSQPTITPGEQQTGLTTEESYDNIDRNSPSYQGSQKKPSILGKLKDKTKKAGSKIKSKVGKKKSADGAPATTADDEEEEEDDSDDSPSPADAASPVVHTTPYTGPESVPREFGTYPSQGKSNLGDSESKETDSTPDMSGLSLDETPDYEQPSATEKASKSSEGAKDAMYGGAAATAGALGYDAASKDHPEEKSVTDKASEASSDAAGKTEELGNRGYDAAAGAKDTVAEKGSKVADQTKETFSSDPSSGGPHSVTDASYETKDAAKSKAADVNNATNDSETYTEKASNAAVAAKDTVADKLGMNQPSEGPSVVDKAKGYFGSAVDTTKAFTFSATDTAKDKTGSATDTTKDYAAAAKDTTKDTTGSAADTTKDYATTTKDTVKDYAGSAYDNTANAAQGATDTTKDYATRAKDTTADAATPKQEDKALSEKITETLGGLTTPANTPTAAHGEGQPGVLGKLTGMLGYGQKGPEDHPHDTTTTH